ncbi:hypothetical protein P9112_006914 [Eukaryota sp. TZLM1-RC]
MSDPLSQSSDTFTTNMQEHDRGAFDKKTAEGVVQTRIDKDPGSGPPSTPPQDKPMESGSEPPPASSKNGTTPSSPKNANVGSSSETSSVLQEYEELQSALDELDDENKELRRQIMNDAEAHLEPTDYCLFQQIPPLWRQTPKIGRNVGFQTVGYKGDSNRVYEIPQNERIELIKAMENLSKDTYERGAERRPRLTAMDKEIHGILAKPIIDKHD